MIAVSNEALRRIVIETKRLRLTKMGFHDFDCIANILQNEDNMYAWGKTFNDDEVIEWINKNIDRYETDGYSYMLATNKSTKEVVGLIGPLVESINGVDYAGIAYIIDSKYRGYGYATEGASACIEYCFDVLGASEVIAEVKTDNTNSMKVAKRLGMERSGSFVKTFNGVEMEHFIYTVEK